MSGLPSVKCPSVKSGHETTIAACVSQFGIRSEGGYSSIATKLWVKCRPVVTTPKTRIHFRTFVPGGHAIALEERLLAAAQEEAVAALVLAAHARPPDRAAEAVVPP